MIAMIFAAGLGTRLRPLTDHCPKALVEVGGVPMLGRVIERLKSAGVDEMVINVHHFPHMIIDYLRANGNFGVRMHVSDESAGLLDTGGGVRFAASMLRGKGPVILHNADIFTDVDVMDMMHRHLTAEADVTLLTSERMTSRYLLFDADGRMGGWLDERTGETRPDGIDVARYRKMAFGGVHVISETVLDRLADYADDGEAFSITPFYIDNCSELKIISYPQRGGSVWFDIGKPATLARAEEHCRKNSDIF